MTLNLPIWFLRYKFFFVIFKLLNVLVDASLTSYRNGEGDNLQELQVQFVVMDEFSNV